MEFIVALVVVIIASFHYGGWTVLFIALGAFGLGYILGAIGEADCRDEP